MNKKQYIFPAAMFVATAVLIVLMIPRGGRYLQNFHLGDRWRGETLTAPFDFSIAKSEVEIADDLQHARRNYIPVYTCDNAAGPAVWNSVQEAILPEESSRMTRQRLENAFRFVYAKGIAASVDHSLTDADGNSFIRIDNGGTLETVSTGEVFTPSSAREYIRRQMSGLAEPLSTDWQTFLLPNLTYNQTLNANLQERELKNVARTKGIVYTGEVIVSRNQLIDQDIYGKLTSLKEEYRSRMGTGDNFRASAVGRSLIVLIVMGITFLYLFYFRQGFLMQRRSVLFVLLVYLIMVGLCSAVDRTDNLSVYLIPFAIVPIYILTFFNIRMSIYELTSILLLCALIVPKPLEFIVIHFVGGVIVLFVLGRAYRRARVFLATGAAFLSNCTCYLAMALIQNGGLHDLDLRMLVWFVANAILFLGMYQLVYLFEKLFGFVSDITLFELSDTNQKLLLELARKAPGTFQHTLQVANLAEAAAKAIGARPLLARTGALYHDIGKLENPGYFIENRGSGNNPHDKLTPSESARIIRRHVTDGLALAKKQRLPAVVADFITGHHGDSLIYYFYAKQREQNGGEEPDQALFRYEGSRPISKEVSICMIADGVEAASRSLPEYTVESIGALVDKIVDILMREGELQSSELSFRDVGAIKEVFREYLENMYHTRISYPERPAAVG